MKVNTLEKFYSNLFKFFSSYLPYKFFFKVTDYLAIFSIHVPTSGSKIYDEDTLNRITIVRLTQVGIKPTEIKRILNVSKSMLYKWVNYQKMEQKKLGRRPKFQESQKDLYKTSEGKLTVSNKVSSRDIAYKIF